MFFWSGYSQKKCKVQVWIDEVKIGQRELKSAHHEKYVC